MKIINKYLLFEIRKTIFDFGIYNMDYGVLKIK
jgi:hypothetical protein